MIPRHIDEIKLERANRVDGDEDSQSNYDDEDRAQTATAIARLNHDSAALDSQQQHRYHAAAVSESIDDSEKDQDDEEDDDDDDEDNSGGNVYVLDGADED